LRGRKIEGLTAVALIVAARPQGKLLTAWIKEDGTTMNGSFLRFYVHEGHRHHHHLVWEWLMQQANKLGIRGGSAFKAMAGFGRHHVLHEASFFELAGTVAVEIEFIVTDDEAERLLALIRKEKIRLFYAHIPARFGVINPDADDLAASASDEDKREQS
jgi:PII-like signaling protein